MVFLVDGLIIMQLVGAAIDHEISGGAAFLFGAFLVTLNGLMIVHAYDAVGPSIALIIVAFAASHRLLRNLANQRALLVIQLEDVREYQRRIAENPKLPYAYRAIGDFFFERGMWEEAIRYYEHSLSLQDDPEVSWRVRHARDELRRQQKGLKVCPRCLNDIPRAARECPLCHHFLGGVDLRDVLGRWWKVEVALLGLAALVVAVWGAVRLAHTNPLMLLSLVPLLVLAGFYSRWYVAALLLRRRLH